MSPVADRYEADGGRLAIDRVDDPKATHAKLPQPVEFAEQRNATIRVRGNCTNCGFDGSLQARMERADHLGYMRRDVRTEGKRFVA